MFTQSYGKNFVVIGIQELESNHFRIFARSTPVQKLFADVTVETRSKIDYAFDKNQFPELFELLREKL